MLLTGRLPSSKRVTNRSPERRVSPASDSVEQARYGRLHPVHSMRADDLGVLHPIFGERDHELSQALPAHIVVDAEFSARLVEGTVQRDELLLIEGLGEHGQPRTINSGRL